MIPVPNGARSTYTEDFLMAITGPSTSISISGRIAPLSRNASAWFALTSTIGFVFSFVVSPRGSYQSCFFDYYTFRVDHLILGECIDHRSLCSQHSVDNFVVINSAVIPSNKVDQVAAAFFFSIGIGFGESSCAYFSHPNGRIADVLRFVSKTMGKGHCGNGCVFYYWFFHLFVFADSFGATASAELGATDDSSETI